MSAVIAARHLKPPEPPKLGAANRHARNASNATRPLDHTFAALCRLALESANHLMAQLLSMQQSPGVCKNFTKRKT